MSIGTWNGIDEPYSASVIIFAGAYHGNESRTNHVELTITKKRLSTDQAWRGHELRDVLLAVVEPWEAEYAVIIGNRFSGTVPCDDRDKPLWPYAGWMTYLTMPLSGGIVPPDGITAERFPDGSLLVTLCDEPCDPDNLLHMALAEAMYRAMRPIQRPIARSRST